MNEPQNFADLKQEKELFNLMDEDNLSASPDGKYKTYGVKSTIEYERSPDEIQELIMKISKGSEYQRVEEKRNQQVREKLDKYMAKVNRAQNNPDYWN